MEHNSLGALFLMQWVVELCELDGMIDVRSAGAAETIGSEQLLCFGSKRFTSEKTAST